MRYIHSMETILDGELSLRDLSKLQRKLSWVWTQSKNVQPLTFDFQIILCQLWLVSWDFSFSFFFFFGKAASGHEQGSKISKDFFFFISTKRSLKEAALCSLPSISCYGDCNFHKWRRELVPRMGGQAAHLACRCPFSGLLVPREPVGLIERSSL